MQFLPLVVYDLVGDRDNNQRKERGNETEREDENLQ